jgi:hypothetical protein
MRTTVTFGMHYAGSIAVKHLKDQLPWRGFRSRLQEYPEPTYLGHALADRICGTLEKIMHCLQRWLDPRCGSYVKPIILACVFLALTIPMVLSGRGESTNFAYGERTSHLPVIRSFVEQWPRVDVCNYATKALEQQYLAMTPGYHLLLAAFARYVSPHLMALRLFNAFIGLAMVLCFYAITKKFSDSTAAFFLALPLCCCLYTIGGSIWLNTDNLAILLACGSLGMSLWSSAGGVIAAGILAGWCVLVRQNYLWLCVPILLSGIQLAPTGQGLSESGTSREPGKVWNCWSGLLVGLTGCLCPLVVAGYFLILWHGFTPPAISSQFKGVNLIALPYALAIFGVLATFLVGYAMPSFKRVHIPGQTLFAMAAAVGAISITVPSSYNQNAERWGGALWEAVRIFPTVADRSPLLVSLAVVGAVFLVYLWNAGRQSSHRRQVLLLFSALIAWAISQVFVYKVTERYYDAMALIILSWILLLSTDCQLPSSGLERSLRAIGPLLLACFGLILICVKIAPFLAWADLSHLFHP